MREQKKLSSNENSMAWIRRSVFGGLKSPILHNSEHQGESEGRKESKMRQRAWRERNRLLLYWEDREGVWGLQFQKGEVAQVYYA